MQAPKTRQCAGTRSRGFHSADGRGEELYSAGRERKAHSVEGYAPGPNMVRRSGVKALHGTLCLRLRHFVQPKPVSTDETGMR